MSKYSLVCPCCGSNISAQVTDSEKVKTSGHRLDCSCYGEEIKDLVLTIHHEKGNTDANSTTHHLEKRSHARKLTAKA